jgi:hypothetical protein
MEPGKRLNSGFRNSVANWHQHWGNLSQFAAAPAATGEIYPQLPAEG